MSTRLKLAVAVMVVGGAVVAAVLVARGDASRDHATLSNAGGPAIGIRGLRLKAAPIREGHVLAVRHGRTFYRLNTVSGDPCFGVGFAGDAGSPGSVDCPRGGFPRSEENTSELQSPEHIV